MKRFTVLSVGVLGLVSSLLTTHALAQVMGCGDIVVGRVTLLHDLSCPSGHGLLLADAATLDCAGHRITGGDQSEQYGIYVRDADDVLVENCVVERFEVGVRLRGAVNVVVQDTVSRNNTRYGMELTQSSAGAVIQRNTIQDNGDEGIHVSGPSDVDAGHQILQNTLEGNEKEGIYLLQSSGNMVADNTIQNNGAAGIYVKQSNRNTLSRNTLLNDPLQLVYGSQQNILTDNTIVGQAIKFNQASSNRVRNLSIQANGGQPTVAFDFTASSNNVIIRSGVDDSEFDIKAASGSTNNVFAKFSAPSPLSCSVDSTSSVSVRDQSGRMISCAKTTAP
ncbi:MAG TPA: right-handed parallel beta-helix repeat-containing protein [Methylomirabilota bacterium]|jgi:parallel beta-helix repeat protein|nr:right-handed parallel beta-helix repeat-containing protein [Methylomirabilota bacterium]